MFFKGGMKAIVVPLFGATVTGVTGGVIGAIIGGSLWVIVAAAVGAIIGVAVWRLGGLLFPLYITTGALIGCLSAIFLRGTEVALLGAAAGGAVGGFLAVNVRMFSSSRS